MSLASAHDFAAPGATPSAHDLYLKFTVAAAVFFVTMEIGYFLVSPWPTWSLPNTDVIGFAFGHDFVNMWMGATTVFEGGPAAKGWFDYPVYNEALRAVLGPDYFEHYWSYPPHFLLLLWPFGLMPYFGAYLAWAAFGFVLYMAACAATMRREHLFFMAAAPAVAMAVLNGQTGMLVAAAMIVGLTQMDKRPILAGVMFGLLTMKPQMGLLLPLLLLLTGRWRVILSAGVTTLVLAGITTAWFGIDIWVQFFTKIMPQQRWLLDIGDGLLLASTVAPLLSLRFLRLPLEFAWAVQYAVSVLCVAAVVWTYWRKRDPVLSIALFITATFLFSPYTLGYDMVIVGWAIALLRERDDNTMFDHYLALGVWLLPIAMPIVSGLTGFPPGVFVMMLFGGRLLWRLRRSSVPSAVALTPA